MENRPAFELRGVLMIYNMFQVIFNGLLFYEFARYGWLGGNYSFICQPVDYSNNETALRMLRAGYFFLISKLIDLVDTLFFVLRKKSNQITVLHVFHHAVLPVSTWPGVRYVGGGNALFFAMINALVHTVMYFYYLLAAMGPKVQKYLGWKKYLTSLQISQFVIVSIHCFQLIFIDCDFPIGYCWWIGAHEIVFLFLFLHFYRQTYVKKDKTESATKTTKKNL